MHLAAQMAAVSATKMAARWAALTAYLWAVQRAQLMVESLVGKSVSLKAVRMDAHWAAQLVVVMAARSVGPSVHSSADCSAVYSEDLSVA